VGDGLDLVGSVHRRPSVPGVTYDNSCVVCRGSGRRTNGQRCGVCDGRGYQQPMSTFSFFKMLYYLAGIIGICVLCGLCLSGRIDRVWGPKAFSVVTPEQSIPAPERFQHDITGRDRG
jgi:hypothetical protein